MRSLGAMKKDVLFEGAHSEQSHDEAMDVVEIGACFLFAIYCVALSGCLS